MPQEIPQRQERSVVGSHYEPRTPGLTSSDIQNATTIMQPAVTVQHPTPFGQLPITHQPLHRLSASADPPQRTNIVDDGNFLRVSSNTGAEAQITNLFRSGNQPGITPTSSDVSSADDPTSPTPARKSTLPPPVRLATRPPSADVERKQLAAQKNVPLSSPVSVDDRSITAQPPTQIDAREVPSLEGTPLKQHEITPGKHTDWNLVLSQKYANPLDGLAHAALGGDLYGVMDDNLTASDVPTRSTSAVSALPHDTLQSGENRSRANVAESAAKDQLDESTAMRNKGKDCNVDLSNATSLATGQIAANTDFT